MALSRLYTPGKMMRTEFFFIKELWSEVSKAWALLLKHINCSFGEQEIYLNKRVKRRGFLDIENIDDQFLCKHGLLENLMLESRPLLLLRPFAALGPLVNFSADKDTLGLERLEIVIPMLMMLRRTSSKITVVVVNPSQMQCHTSHGDGFDLYDIENCHKSAVKNMLIDLHSMLTKGDDIFIFEQRELLGQKNSALFERLFIK